jgi:uncharacterized membrane protein YraQ (UPF0718 family)
LRASLFPRISRRFLSSLPYAATAVLLLAGLLSFAGSLLGGLPPVLLSLLDGLSGFSAVFLGIFIEAAPFLLLGTLASGLVEVFITREDMARWIPRRAFTGALAGGLLGLFFPVCECGVVPFTRRMLQKGLPLPAAVSLLLAAPVVNPIVIASTLAAFGPGMIFWGRIAFSLLVAVVVGTVFGLAEPSAVLRPEVLKRNPMEVSAVISEQRPRLRERLRRMLVIAGDEFFEMGRFLVIGALLAALMQTFIPQASLLNLGQGPLSSVLVMIALAILLSICSTVDAFIALAFAGTFSAGSILAFLVYGPMVDIKSTLMFLRVFQKKTVIYLVLLPFLLVVFIGFVVNLL